MSLSARLRQDELLSRVLQSSLHLFSTNSLALAASFAQGVLAYRILGAAGFGLLGIVMSFASTVNGLLSFRMGELVVRYGGEYVQSGDKERLAALVKAAALAEAAVSLLAFIVVAAAAGLASQLIAKTPGSTWMFIVYGIGLLANFNTETSTGILQIKGSIKLRGTINLIQSVLTLLITGAAFLWHGGMVLVLAAYLAGKACLGLGLFLAAQIELRRTLGPRWLRTPVSGLPNLRELARFAVSSNLSATAILIFRDSEMLWVGYFLNTEAAGYYKIAYSIIWLLSVPADPLILTVYPELNRLIVQKAWPRLRGFLRSVTTFSFAYNLLIALALGLFGRVLLWIYGDQQAVAYPAMLALLIGFTFNYILFWNRPLLLALGRPVFPLAAILIAGALKMVLAFLLVPRFGFVMEAALLSFYYIFSVGLMVWRGTTEIRRREHAAAVQLAEI